MALKKLYPPEIEGVIPAFCGTTLVVPFSMNKTVSKSEISGMIIKIKTVFSNQYLGYAKTYFNGATQENLDRVSFDLSSFIDKLNIGDIIQLSFDGIKFSQALIVIKNGTDIYNTQVSAHTDDVFGKIVGEYNFIKYRCVHIAEES